MKFWLTFLEPDRDIERVAVLYEADEKTRQIEIIERIAREVRAQFGPVRPGVVTQARHDETRTMVVGGMDEPIFSIYQGGAL